MNATFDGARIHQQDLDREIDSLRTEKLINSSRAPHPGPITRGLASVGRGLISVGTALASRDDAQRAQQSAGSGGQA
jgi:hypothetical protein